MSNTRPLNRRVLGGQRGWPDTVSMPVSRLFHRVSALLVGALVMIAVFVAPAVAAPPVALSGAYVGAASAGTLQAFGTWRESQATIASDYLADKDWSSVENPSWWLNGWQPFTSTGGQLLLAVPLLTGSGQTFADGAAGAYDSYFKSLATNLVAEGDANAILRLGWEFNGTWYAWSLSASNSADGPAEFIAYWRHVVTLMRAVAGSNFKFDWNVNNGPEPVDATQAYPGNSYVDYIGVDTYDNGYGVSTPQARWSQIVNQSYGLNFWANFAKGQGKPISIPEWGLSTDASAGGGDDPYYVQQMYSWLQQNRAAFEVYFDYQGSLTSGSTPNAAAEYRSLWSEASATTSGSSTTSGSTTTSGSATSSSTTTSGSTVTGGKGSKPQRRERALKHRASAYKKAHRAKAHKKAHKANRSR